MDQSLLVLVGLLSVPVALAVLTAVGERKRGGSWVVAALAGLFFPLTWVGWYVLDRRPTAT